MPRSPGTRICVVKDINCYTDAEENLMTRQYNYGREDVDRNIQITSKCNCLPGCTSINYDAEISQGGYDFHNYIMSRNDNYSKEISKYQFAVLRIFFKETQFITSKRSELYGLTDFIANCGGLLGLFIGVSTLSIVEIFYYLTIRLTKHFKKMSFRKKNKEPVHQNLAGVFTVKLSQ